MEFNILMLFLEFLHIGGLSTVCTPSFEGRFLRNIFYFFMLSETMISVGEAVSGSTWVLFEEIELDTLGGPP